MDTAQELYDKIDRALDKGYYDEVKDELMMKCLLLLADKIDTLVATMG